MGKRGPGSSKKLSVIEPTTAKRPNPLPGMTAPSRTIWKRIVSVFPPDHFKPQHYDLLRMYCEAASINKIAIANAAKEDFANKYWILIADKQASVCTALSLKLGISVNSTLASRRKEYAGKAPEQKSKRAGLLYGGQK